MIKNNYAVQYFQIILSTKETTKMFYTYPTLEIASAVAEFLYKAPEFVTPEGRKAKVTDIRVLTLQ